MEEPQVEQNQESQEVLKPQEAPTSNSSGVSFPTVGQTKKVSSQKLILILGVLILVGILGFVIFRGGKKEEAPTSTPVSELETPVPTPVPSPTATPKPTDKTKIEIEIQNGTGITGEAAYLQGQLKALGYSNLKIGNAEKQDYTKTSATFSKNLSSDLTDEMTKKLKEIYKEVETSTSTTLKVDALIITGLRKGVTPKPSPTATPKATATPTSSPLPSPSPTATP